MASDLGTTQGASARTAENTRSTGVRRSTETKHSSKTSELYVWAAVTAGILIAAALIKGETRRAPTSSSLARRGCTSPSSRRPTW